MNRPQPYETIYAHDRRAHRHRCFYCGKILNSGEPVIMWKASAKVTRAMHLLHANMVNADGITMRQLAQFHSDDYARSLGHSV